MTDRVTWTDETMGAYASVCGLALPSEAFAARLRMMAQKAAHTSAALPRDFGWEDQPAFTFVPGLRS